MWATEDDFSMPKSIKALSGDLMFSVWHSLNSIKNLTAIMPRELNCIYREIYLFHEFCTPYNLLTGRAMPNVSFAAMVGTNQIQKKYVIGFHDCQEIATVHQFGQ